VIEDVLRFCIDAGGGVSLSRLRVRFPTIGQVLRICLDRELLELRGDCYYPTAAGRAWQPDVEIAVKRCPGCGMVKSETEFWKDASHSHGPHGLYAYCKTCCKRRKERLMEAKQLEARAAIRSAAQQLVRAAARWDAAVVELARAWQEIAAVDDVRRLNQRSAGSDFDSGRMEGRLLQPRALFGLSLALADVNFNIGHILHRDCEMKPQLADYVGTDPERDYLGQDSATPLAELGGAGAANPSAAPAPSPRRRAKRVTRRMQLA
jgi:hypothetical protein